jgi:hypothetical protein
MTRPLPQPNPATSPYWNGARQHRLMLPKCTQCSRVHFYPKAICPHCSADTFEWIEPAGRGTIHSFTIVKRAPSPAFEAQVPYVVAIVALDEGPCLMSNVVSCDPGAVRIGDKVKVSFLDVTDEDTLPVFEPLQQAE